LAADAATVQLSFAESLELARTAVWTHSAQLELVQSASVNAMNAPKKAIIGWAMTAAIIGQASGTPHPLVLNRSDAGGRADLTQWQQRGAR